MTQLNLLGSNMKLLKSIKKYFCNHNWEYDPSNSAKRTCKKCGRHEWMMANRYPSFDEPSLKWFHMAHHDI